MNPCPNCQSTSVSSTWVWKKDGGFLYGLECNECLLRGPMESEDNLQLLAANWNRFSDSTSESKQVSFTRFEIDSMRSLAESIRSNKKADISDGTWDGKGFEERNFKGLKGAYAVARFLGVDFDRTLRSGKDLGWDLTFRGWTIEVKNLQRWLAFHNLSHFSADIAVLVNPVMNSEDVILQGWVSKARFRKNYFTSNFGYGDRMCMKQDDLDPMPSLRKIKAKDSETV